MRVKFCIIRLKFPTSYDEFSGFVIAEVRIVQCKHKPELEERHLTFKGKLPSCAPYFVYDTDVFQVNENELKGLSDALFEQELTKDTLDYIRTVELPRYISNHPDVETRRIYGATMAVLSEMPENLTDTLNLSFVDAVPILHDMPYAACDFWRLQYSNVIVSAFENHPKQTAIYKHITRLSFEDLKKMTRFFKEDPIRACFVGQSPFKYTLTYGAFMKLAPKGKYKPFEITAVRLLDYIRSNVVGKHNNTAEMFDKLQRDFLEINPSDKERYDQAFWYLAREKQVVYDTQSKFVTLPHLYKAANGIAESLSRIFSKPQEDILRGADALVPCIPKALTDEQTLAALHMLNNPLTIITGPPGRGKTNLIECGMAYWKALCVVSYVGTVVGGHRRRMGGHMEASNTAHFLYKSAGTLSGVQWAASFTAFMWDEFSNVHDSLCCKTLRVLPNVQNAVFVFDPAQIAPLDVGSPAMDLLEAFPQHSFHFTKNLRTNPRAKQLADAVLHVLHGKPEEMEWSYSVDDRSCLTLLHEVATYASIRKLISFILQNPETYKVKNVVDIQFIAFTKKTCKEINAIVEGVFIDLGVVKPGDKPIQINKHCKIYVGCKITILGENFPAVKDDDGDVIYDAVRNGDCGVVTHCGMTKDGKATVVKFDTGEGVIKCMLISKQIHVDPSKVQLGHAITANKAQALEYNTVVGVFAGYGVDGWVYRSHFYVMASRAKEAFIALGEHAEAEIKRICQRTEPRRQTILKQILKKTVFADEEPAKQTLYEINPNDVETDTRSWRCTPSIEQFQINKKKK